MSEDLIAKLRAVRVPTKEEVMAQGELMLDEQCRSGLVGTQDEWVTYWKGEKGKKLASMPDYYAWFSQLKGMAEGNGDYVSQLLATFHKEISSVPAGGDARLVDYLITNTLVENELEKSFMRVRHDRGWSRLHRIIDVPKMLGGKNRIGRFANHQYGEDFLQALFDTKDDSKEIIKTLEFASGVSPDSILVETVLTEPFAKYYPHVATFELSSEYFTIRLIPSFLKDRSRGVKYYG